MLCDELKVYVPQDGPYGLEHEEGGKLVEEETCYLKSEVDAAIAELKDKCQMHDFFWEGCGFAKRGFKNSIAVSEAFDKLEAENAELKKKLMPCLNGDCILTCEVVEKYGKENAELKQKLDEKDMEIESLKASHYAEMVDAGMRERMLKRALWLARARRASAWQIHFALSHNHSIKREFTINGASSPHDRMVTMRTARDWAMIWKNVERKCRAKAEEYK